MNRFALAIAALALSPCDASAEVFGFEFPINTLQANPAPDLSGLDPLPMGRGFASLDTDSDTLSWTVTYQDLSGPIVAPGAHFHGPAARGGNAGIQVFLTDGDPPEPASGVLTGSAMLTQQQQDDLLAGLWYVNIHTAQNQPGEIRGQVVPEPASFAMVGAGLSALAALRRRLR